MQIQPDSTVTPDNRPWAYILSEVCPDLWDRYVIACRRESELPEIDMKSAESVPEPLAF